ncbi:MAG: M48 family metalloprotease [Pseudomonadota bacterium]
MLPIRTTITLLAALVVTLVVNSPAQAQSIIRDTEIEETLREWTDPILDVAGLRPADVDLYIINDPSLNAFVAGGQNIHLNTGLIIAADNPGQILGVIGHETCHIACGHTVSRTRAAEVASRPALVSIGLGILALAAGAGDAGVALLASSQQFAALNFFKHTRSEEAAADAAAVAYLAALGLSPAGLVEFFENYRYQEVLSDTRRDPYFRAHPLASDRIRTARQLAEDTGLMDVPPTPEMLRQFDMMQAKLVGFLEPAALVRRNYPPDDTSLAARYARSIAAMQAGDLTASIREIDALIAEEPENPFFHELKGQTLYEAGKVDESIPPYERANELKPGQPLLQIGLAQSLTQRGVDDDLARAEELLKSSLLTEPRNAFAWRELSITLHRMGRNGEADVAYAEASLNIGNYPDANIFAGRALKKLEKGTPTFIQALDILNQTDPRLPENAPYYRRRGLSQ